MQVLSAVGHGCPDLLVGFRGVNYLLEIKDGGKPPGDRKLTGDERTWHSTWGGRCAVVTDVDGALAAVGIRPPPVRMEEGERYRVG